jgi:protein-S-isoprenylcysteine O-methyltransferase Ste14
MIFGIALIGAMLFLPAWTWRYFGAWLFIGVLFVPMLFTGLVLFLKAPDLLKKRLDFKEKEKTQGGVIALSGLMFPVAFVLSAFDFRYGWSHLPIGIVIGASILFLLSYALYAEVMRENAYLSRTIEIQDNQKLIDTGLYRIVRHPMYTVTIVMFLTMPLILGSAWGLLVFAFYPILIVLRIRNEEQILMDGLEGYRDYQKRVPYRLIPWVW